MLYIYNIRYEGLVPDPDSAGQANSKSTRWRSSKELPVFCGSLYNFSRENALGFRALGLGCRVHNIEPITAPETPRMLHAQL